MVFSIFPFFDFKFSKIKKILKDFRKCSSQKIFSKNIFKKYFSEKYFRKKYSRKQNFFYFQYFLDRIEVLESLSSLVSTKMRFFVGLSKISGGIFDFSAGDFFFTSMGQTASGGHPASPTSPYVTPFSTASDAANHDPRNGFHRLHCTG